MRRWATFLESWASFRRKDGSDNDQDGPGRNAERSFHEEKRSNETHASTTDPEARLYKKGDGQPAKLSYFGHALMENRNGLAVLGGGSQAVIRRAIFACRLTDFVLHVANVPSGGSTERIEISDFLSEGRNGPEHQALRQLIGRLGI
jgi:hypothetical protein